MTHPDVLIVGAGPTGLVSALWLTRQGIAVRIIDKSTGPGQTSRAMAVQARTLEFYRQLDIADEVVKAGYKMPAMNFWAQGVHRARVPLADAGQEITPYPFVLVFPQDLHERLLVAKLLELGVTVERETELISFAEDGSGINAQLRTSDGTGHTCVARYIAGCDGARSTVRHGIGSGFEGGTYKQTFYVADVALRGLNPPTEAHVSMDASDFVVVMPYGNATDCRLIGIVRDDGADPPERPTFENVAHDATVGLGIQVDTVNWFSTYRVHHRVTDHFRRGRAFLLGDAAHVHSPAGGQGMNTGIADAINLAWKLAAVIKGEATDALLDSYEPERQAFARTLVETTDRLFTFATAQGNVADFVRLHVAPLFMGVAYRFETVREFMFRLISQTTLTYRESPLSEGTSGDVQAGDRLPWISSPGLDNYESLTSIAWQMHVYGDAKPELKAWCGQRGLALHEFAWNDVHGKAGLVQDGAYLLRPDTYIAFVDPSGMPAAAERYLASRGIGAPVASPRIDGARTT